MAKIGLRYPCYKGTNTQGVIAKAIQADINISVNDVKLYADDVIAETDKSFQSGTITLNIDDLSDTVQVDLLGHTKAVTDEITANVNDDAPYVGIGFYGVKKVAGVIKYRAIWLPKVKFSEPSDINKAKGENTEFSTSTIEGMIIPDDSGNWKYEQTFATEALAIAYLQNKSGVKAQCTMPVANVASGTYTSVQTVSLTAGVGETIYYTTNGTTPSATNGTEYTTAITVSESCGLKAIAIKAEMTNSYVATYEYIIDLG